jgi:hypothetical protein
VGVLRRAGPTASMGRAKFRMNLRNRWPRSASTSLQSPNGSMVAKRGWILSLKRGKIGENTRVLNNSRGVPAHMASAFWCASAPSPGLGSRLTRAKRAASDLWVRPAVPLFASLSPGGRRTRRNDFHFQNSEFVLYLSWAGNLERPFMRHSGRTNEMVNWDVSRRLKWKKENFYLDSP